MEKILPAEMERIIILADKVGRQVCTHWCNVFDKFAHEIDPELLPSNLLQDKHFAIINNGQWGCFWKLSNDFAIANIDKLDWDSWNLYEQSQEFLFKWSDLKDDIAKTNHQLLRFYDNIEDYNFGINTTAGDVVEIDIELRLSEDYSEIRCLSPGKYYLTIAFRKICRGKLTDIFHHTFIDFGSNCDILIQGKPLNVAVECLIVDKFKKIII